MQVSMNQDNPIKFERRMEVFFIEPHRQYECVYTSA